MNEPGSDANLSQRLLALRQAFRDRMPMELESIRALREELRAANWDGESLARLLRAVHSFTTAATGFGFDELGEASRVVEIALRSATPATLREEAELRAGLDARFDALLALPLPDPRDASPPARRGDERRGGRDVKQRKRLFMLDDNVLVCRQLADQLGLFGYDATCCHDVESFAEACARGMPDAMLIDFDFADQDDGGPARIDRLLDGAAKRPPLIVMATHDDIGARLRAIRIGSDRFLLKPPVVTELIDALDDLLDETPVMPYRILIVDDSAAIGGLYAGILEGAGMRVRSSTDPLAALDLIAEFQPDIALIDLYMPDCNGEELAAVIRQHETHAGLPIVFLSSETDRNRQISAMRFGADEFLTKPIHPEHLIATVTIRAGKARQLRTLIQRDSLTTLLNHGSFVEGAATEIARARRLGMPCTLALLDIDHFKTINDVHGHAAGDRVLKSIARRLRHRLRAVDLVGRYAGEEFCVMLSGADGPTARNVIDGLREDFSRLAHSSAKGMFHVYFSAGLAAFPEFDSVDQLIDAADRALSDAKHRGRNCSVLAQCSTTDGQNR